MSISTFPGGSRHPAASSAWNEALPAVGPPPPRRTSPYPQTTPRSPHPHLGHPKTASLVTRLPRPILASCPSATSFPAIAGPTVPVPKHTDPHRPTPYNARVPARSCHTAAYKSQPHAPPRHPPRPPQIPAPNIATLPKPPSRSARKRHPLSDAPRIHVSYLPARYAPPQPRHLGPTNHPHVGTNRRAVFFSWSFFLYAFFFFTRPMSARTGIPGLEPLGTLSRP